MVTAKPLIVLALFATVLRCESDGEIVKPRDVFQGRHVSERDAQGRIVSLCGYVHRVSLHHRRAK
jgi:hypothetical protein